jgi:hypothetical protein
MFMDKHLKLNEKNRPEAALAMFFAVSFSLLERGCYSKSIDNPAR